MIALLPALTCLALGSGAVLLLARSMPLARAVAAGALLGPPLTTVTLFGLHGLGFAPAASLAWTVASLAIVALAAGLRGCGLRPRLEDRTGAWIVLLGVLVVALESVLAWLAEPAPRGDGLSHFGYKARVLGELGSLLPWMADERILTLHPDYPPHQPWLLWLGHGFSGRVDHLAALSPTILWLPGLVGWLGLGALPAGRLAAALVTLFLVLTPGIIGFAQAGYADPWITALLAVSALTLFGREGLAVAAVAAGLLPFVKLEGVVHLIVLGVLGLIFATRKRSRILLAGTGAGLLAAPWYLVLLREGRVKEVSEHAPTEDLGAYVAELIREFAAPIIDPSMGFHLAAPVALLGLVIAIARPHHAVQRSVATFTLVLALGYPLLSFVRRTAVLGRDTDVPERLTGHWMPLALFILGLTIASFLRRSDAAEDVAAESR